MPDPAVDPELLELLACPETHQPLAVADAALLQRLEAARSSGALKTVAGAAVDEAVEAALVREDGRVAYPIRDGIPVLLVDQGLAVPNG